MRRITIEVPDSHEEGEPRIVTNEEGETEERRAEPQGEPRGEGRGEGQPERAVPPSPVKGEPGFENEDDDHYRRRVERYNNLIRDGERTAGQRHNGLSGIRADALSPEDLVAMAHFAEYAPTRFRAARRPSTPNVYQALLVGSNEELARAVQAYEYDRKDVLPHKQAYKADAKAWLAKYGSTPLEKAFHAWLRKEGV